MTKVCVLNVAVKGWYPNGQDRLLHSLKNAGYTDSTLFWRGSYPPNSPTHEETPYAFKIHAFKYAESQGFDIALWLDASIYAVRTIQPVIDHIASRGYLLPLNCNPVGAWCSDPVLQSYNTTREDAMQIKQVMACGIGFNLKSPIYSEFMDEWYTRSCDGFSFRGSPERIIKTHRHDQTIASFIAHRMGLELNTDFITYDQDSNTHPLICAGMFFKDSA